MEHHEKIIFWGGVHNLVKKGEIYFVSQHVLKVLFPVLLFEKREGDARFFHLMCGKCIGQVFLTHFLTKKLLVLPNGMKNKQLVWTSRISLVASQVNFYFTKV